MTTHKARALDVDLGAVATERRTAADRIDSHAYHSTADNVMNVYGRANNDRFAEACKRVGRVLLKPEGVPGEYRIPDDLRLVIEAWEDLTDGARSAIVTLVGSVENRHSVEP